jgi:vancomycin permeability regulator SanA
LNNTILIVLGNPAENDGTPGKIMKSRIDKAIKIFKGCSAEKIIFSGNSNHNSFNEADVMAEYALQKGIPEASIIRERNASDTLENAVNTYKILQDKNYKNLIIITSRFHYKRTKYIFKRYFDNFEILIVPLPENTGMLRRIKLYLWEMVLFIKLVLFGDKRF